MFPLHTLIGHLHIYPSPQRLIKLGAHLDISIYFCQQMQALMSAISNFYQATTGGLDYFLLTLLECLLLACLRHGWNLHTARTCCSTKISPSLEIISFCCSPGKTPQSSQSQEIHRCSSWTHTKFLYFTIMSLVFLCSGSHNYCCLSSQSVIVVSALPFSQRQQTLFFSPHKLFPCHTGAFYHCSTFYIFSWDCWEFCPSHLLFYQFLPGISTACQICGPLLFS